MLVFNIWELKLKKAKGTIRTSHFEKERKKWKKREKEGKEEKLVSFNVFNLRIYYCYKLRLIEKLILSCDIKKLMWRLLLLGCYNSMN